MKKLTFLVFTLVICFVAKGQEEIDYNDSTQIVSGSPNISVHMGRNSGNNSSPEKGLVSPGLLVGNVNIGYQYKVSETWGLNTSLGIGYQSFRFRTVDDVSKDIFNEITFMMPYFGLEIELKRTLHNDFFLGIGVNLHVNTLAAYEANYNVVSSKITSFDKLSLERNRNEYAGVQHGLGFTLGKQITSGSWSGIDLFVHALILNRQKLVIDYWYDGKYEETNPEQLKMPTGKISYNGGFIGLGICYNFKG